MKKTTTTTDPSKKTDTSKTSDPQTVSTEPPKVGFVEIRPGSKGKNAVEECRAIFNKHETVGIPVAMVCSMTGYSSQRIYRALRELTEVKFILRHKQDGTFVYFRNTEENRAKAEIRS